MFRGPLTLSWPTGSCYVVPESPSMAHWTQSSYLLLWAIPMIHLKQKFMNYFLQEASFWCLSNWINAIVFVLKFSIFVPFSPDENGCLPFNPWGALIHLFRDKLWIRFPILMFGLSCNIPSTPHGFFFFQFSEWTFTSKQVFPTHFDVSGGIRFIKCLSPLVNNMLELVTIWTVAPISACFQELAGLHLGSSFSFLLPF